MFTTKITVFIAKPITKIHVIRLWRVAKFAAGIVALGREGFHVVVVGSFNVCSVNFKTFSAV